MRYFLLLLLCVACSGCAASRNFAIEVEYKDVQVRIEPKSL